MTENNGTVVRMPWVEKYRPNCLDDLISHEEIISTSKFSLRSTSNRSALTFFFLFQSIAL